MFVIILRASIALNCSNDEDQADTTIDWKLHDLAGRFAAKIPKDTFNPAELSNYLFSLHL
jgi:hypothetical protein